MKNMKMIIASHQPKPDGMRCSPVYSIVYEKKGRIKSELTWCNAGTGRHGHLGAVEGMPFCAACGQEIGNEKVMKE
tara:strand:- start:30 stop:257 length:228 start_codon:yes stop_codon:yes gene_type:complete